MTLRRASLLKAHQQPRFSAEDRALLERATSTGELLELGDLHDSWNAGPGQDHPLATALLYDRVLRRSENRAFLQRVIEGHGEVDPSQFKVGLVPGAFYREHAHTGADGARIASLLEDLGLRTELIPVHSFGRVEENARIILEWLQRQTAANLAIISLSKGGAECRTALQMSGCTGWESVKAWVSLSGLAQGTPLVAWLRGRRLRMVGVRFLLWCRGQSFRAAEDIRHDDGDLSTAWPELPPHLRLVHVIAFPLAHHLRHPWAPKAYRRLSPLGPSDGGGFLLADAARLPGILCPVWGVDHYLDPAWDSAAFLRNLILEALTPAPTLTPAQSRTP